MLFDGCSIEITKLFQTVSHRENEKEENNVPYTKLFFYLEEDGGTCWKRDILTKGEVEEGRRNPLTRALFMLVPAKGCEAYRT